MKILYLTNIPSPYRVSFFNELGKSCDLTVLFELESSNERESSWHDYRFDNFNAKILKSIRFNANTALSLEVTKYLADKSYDMIVVGGYATPTGVVAINYLRIRKIPFVLNVDGGMINLDEGIIKNKIKTYFISSAKAWLSTGMVASDYLNHYGAKENEVYVYPFTTLFKKDIRGKIIENSTKVELREELNKLEDIINHTIKAIEAIKKSDDIVEVKSKFTLK